MLLTALVDHYEHVCCRYRLAAFRPFLEQAGHRLQLRLRPRTGLDWLRLGRQLHDTDVVVLQRKLLHDWQMRLLGGRLRWLVFDFDDAVFLRRSSAGQGLYSQRRLRRFAGVVRRADLVVAGNVFLSDQTTRYTGGDRVHVVPTCLNPASYPLAEHRHRADEVELVWIGSGSTLQGLEQARPILEALGQHVPGLHLKIICDRFFRLQHLPVVERLWSSGSEGAELAAADVGLSWLPNDLWSRGKCGLKLLQYMAAGLPVVANPVGVQTEMVQHGETGFLAETPEQWVEAVKRLARDPALRRRMGRAGRQRVETRFSVSVGTLQWLRLLEGLQGGRYQWQSLPDHDPVPAEGVGSGRRLRFS